MLGSFLIVWLLFTLFHLFFASSFNDNFMNNLDSFYYLSLMNLFFTLILYVCLKLKKN